MSNSTETGYRRDIDGLRAVAVLSVLFYHAKLLGFTGGFVGVDVFFVISGYLISGILLRELAATQTLSLTNFFARRMRRLFPALAVVILFCLSVWPLIPTVTSIETEKFAQSVRFAVFGFANFFFNRNTGGYFDGSSDEMPLLHFWSLAVEEQFYLVWPLLLLFCFSFLKKDFSKKIFILLGILSLLSFAGSVWCVDHQAQKVAFYMMPFRIWQLGLGALITIAQKQGLTRLHSCSQKNQKVILEVLSVAGLLLIAGAVFGFKTDDPFPGWRALIPSIGTGLLIFAGTPQLYQSSVAQVLALPGFVFLGAISYSLYLWHWPLLALSQVANLGQLPPAVVRAGLLILSVGFGFISYKYVETPFRSKLFFPNLPPARFIGATLMIGILICVAGWLSASATDHLADARRINKGIDQVYPLIQESYPMQKLCTDQMQKWKSDVCTVGSSGSIDILVWGDSHAFAQFPAIQKYVESHPTANAILMSTNGILPILDPSIQGYPEYKEFFRNYLATKKNRTSVFLSARWLHYLGLRGVARGLKAKNISNSEECCTNGIAATYEESLALIQSSFQATIKRLNDLGVYRILIPLPYPEFPYPPEKCLSTRPASECAVSQAAMVDYRSGVVMMLQKIADQFPNVHLVDPMNVFCDGIQCPQVLQIQGRLIPTVKDDNHISVSAAQYWSQSLTHSLDWLVGEE